MLNQPRSGQKRNENKKIRDRERGGRRGRREKEETKRWREWRGRRGKVERGKVCGWELGFGFGGGVSS